MTPETHGTVALYVKGFLNAPYSPRRVIAWDAEGFALIADCASGRLVLR